MHLVKLLYRRGTAAIAAALFVVPTLVIASASPASAACAQSHYYYVPGTNAAVSFDWNPECSDGVAQVWNGVVYDTLCDSKAAAAQIWVDDRSPSGAYNNIAISDWYNSKTGCGNSSTFTTWRPRSPGSIGWRLRVRLRACTSSSGCTDSDWSYFYG
jgi:hypothetical protein